MTADSVTTRLAYIVDTGVEPVTHVARKPGEERSNSGTYEDHDAVVHNARPRAAEWNLDKEGFVLRPQQTQVGDFYDAKEVERVYYSELERLLKEHTGAREVVVFDTTIRAESEATREAKGVGRPVRRIHNDYTAWSAPKRLREILPDRADKLMERRFAIVNVWRTIAGTVESMPLGLCEAGSIEEKDLVATTRQAADRVGEIQHLAYNPRHRWHYFPRLTAGEALLFKRYDSASDGRARYTAHCAFVDPTTPAGAAPRESIEARAFVLF